MSTRTIRRWLLIVNGIIVIASTGCQTMTNRMARVAPQQPGASEQSTPTGMAKTDFHREISRDQQFNVHMQLAKVHESQGNNDAALAEYEQAVMIGERRGSILASGKLGPEPLSIAHRRMAATYDRMGRFALAETHYNVALKLAPNDPKVWNDAGYSYYLQNRLTDAERALKTAKTFAPNDARILTNLGLTQAVAGKIDEALGTLSQAGGPAVGHANLGYILASTGKPEEARKQYEAALAMQPDLSSARQALAKLDSQPTATAIARRDDPNRPLDPSSERLDPNVAATSIPNAAPPTDAPNPVQGSAAVNPVEVPAAEPRPAASSSPNVAVPVSTTLMPQEAISAPRLDQAATSASTESTGRTGTGGMPARDAATSWIEPVKALQTMASQPMNDPQSQVVEPVTSPVVSVPDYAPPPSRPVSEPNEAPDNSIPLTVVGEDDPASARETAPNVPRTEAVPRSEPLVGEAHQVIASKTSSDVVTDAQVPEPAPAPAPPAAPNQEAAPPSAATPAPAPEIAPEAPSAPAPVSAATPAPAPAPAPVSESTPAPAPTTQAAPAAADSAPETPDPADLRNPFPADMSQLLTTPQSENVSEASQAQGAYPSKSAPTQPVEPSVSLSKIKPSQQSAMTPQPGALPTSNPEGPYGSRSLDPNTKNLPSSYGPASDRLAPSGGPNSQSAIAPMASTPAKSQPEASLDPSKRPYRAQPALPSKSSPVGTVPGWAVPKNYRTATYPPTPSDLATRAPRKMTPSNTIPPTPW